MKTQNHDAKDKGSPAAHATEGVIEVQNRLQSMLDSVGEAYTGLKEKAVDKAKSADEIIRANPYQAMGIAFGVGALLGFLWSRRSRD